MNEIIQNNFEAVKIDLIKCANELIVTRHIGPYLLTFNYTIWTTSVHFHKLKFLNIHTFPRRHEVNTSWN